MKTLLKQFRDDENGAAMVEYTVLLGIIWSEHGSAASGWRSTPLCPQLNGTLP
jgi:hypothetical protein